MNGWRKSNRERAHKPLSGLLVFHGSIAARQIIGKDSAYWASLSDIYRTESDEFGKFERPYRQLIGESLNVDIGLTGRARYSDCDGCSNGRKFHLSISPNTTSSVPMIAATSASWWPFEMWSIAWRWA